MRDCEVLMGVGKSAREFSIDLKKFGEVTEEKAQTIFRKIGIDLDSAIVLDTPVDTGRARGNWFMSIGAPSDARDDNRLDPGGGNATAEIVTTFSLAKLGSVVWMTNNLPYILPLEQGSSKQSAKGMVDVNLARAQAKYGGSIK
jgi:hypothetical protein